MTKDQIMKLAREAGFEGMTDHPAVLLFANLVAGHEREACAKVCEAGIVDETDWDNSYWNQCCENRAAAIRARSQA